MGAKVSRRSFLKLAAATGAVAAIPGCQPAARHLVPYVVPDENVTPGLPTFYATTCSECPAGCGVIARVREGRVIKLEGNPLDPIGKGTLCARGQASLQGLYNPDRLRSPRVRENNGRSSPVSWQAAMNRLNAELKAAATAGSDRVVFFGGSQGPTLRKVVQAWLKTYNSGRLIAYEAIDYQPMVEAVQRCYGRTDKPVYQIDAAKVIVSFGADFLETWLSPVEFTRQYAAFRAVRKEGDKLTMGQAVYVGPRMNLTAANTDEWVAIRPGTEGAVAMAVLNALAEQGLVRAGSGLDANALHQFTADFTPEAVAKLAGISPDKIRQLAKLLGQAPSSVALGAADDPLAQVATMLLNTATGNLGVTMKFVDAPEVPTLSSRTEIADAIKAMHDGGVDVLVIADTNPVFTMPPEFGITEALKRVKFVVWAGGVPDETAEFAHLLLPIDHPLESWDDAAPRPGVLRLRQPVTQRVFDSRLLGDILLESLAQGPLTPAPVPWKTMLEALKANWREIQQQVAPNEPFDQFWTKVLSEGGIYTELKFASVSLSSSALNEPPKLEASTAKALRVACYPHIFFYDGRGANKPWLQEIPEPVSQIVWDNWVEIHPETAKRLDISEGQVVEVVSKAGRVALAAYISPRIHPDAVAIPFGQGHVAYGRYASGRGGNPWHILPPGRFAADVELRPTQRREQLVSPVSGGNMMGRPIVETVSLTELERGKLSEEEESFPEPHDMYEPYEYPKHHWGMTIDLNACTGCSACVAACYAENNIPVVGKEQVALSRIMSWIRIERYWPENSKGPLMLKLPMLCQQCGQAPCEPVCPVFASYHTEEGLNGQIYNRCIGTRYCSNNCPYKVRRFNWFVPSWPHPLQLQLNPDVTVRGAGVMEKCTFCIQRIRFAEMQALTGQQPLTDGVIVPACAQTCPANAITFGDMKDQNSAVMRRRNESHLPNPQLRNYRVLNQYLETKPAIVYLRTVYREQREG